MRDHTVVVGFGTKGRAAIQAVCATGLKKDRVVVIDPSAKAIDAATAQGYAAVLGDATRSDVLRRAEVQRARQIIIATQRDDAAVLVALTARQLNQGATIVVAVREDENAPLLRQSGADQVITSAGAAGRLLGLSVLSPTAGLVMEDLIRQGSGLDVVDRPVTRAEVGRSPRETEDLVISVVRGHRVLHYDDPAVRTLELTDRVITITPSAASETPRGATPEATLRGTTPEMPRTTTHEMPRPPAHEMPRTTPPGKPRPSASEPPRTPGPEEPGSPDER